MEILITFGFLAIVITVVLLHLKSETDQFNKEKEIRLKALAKAEEDYGNDQKNAAASATNEASKIDALIRLGDFLYKAESATTAEDLEGLNYYKAAAALNSKIAYRRLAVIYLNQYVPNSNGMANKLEMAFECNLKAAELGHEESMRIVAEWYKTGRGVLKNIGKSTYWLLRSAESGNVQSMTEVAHTYITGFGVQENPMEGLAWLYVAEYKRNEDAASLIKNAESKLNSALILLAQDRAKVILDLIKDGDRTSPASVSGNSAATLPGQTASQKPKHAAKGSGSGAVISPFGHIVTAAHVIKDSTYIEVITPAGTFAGSVLNCDEQNDVALLKIEQAFELHIPVGRSSEVRLGQSVATIGFPNIGIQGHSPKVTQGMISGDNGIQNDIRMWQISVPIQPGNSGGPLLDETGRMVGVVVATLGLRAVQVTGSVPQNVNYAIKGAYLEPLLSFHKLPLDNSVRPSAPSFQDMIAVAQKSSVLILTY